MKQPFVPDLLKRFTPTPIANAFVLHGATVRVATNFPMLADRLQSILPRAVSEASTEPDFVWRVVVEPDNEVEGWAMPSCGLRLSHNGLAFVSMGQKSFLASDLEARQGISFISESIASDERLFRQYFLPGIIALVKESLEQPSGASA